MHFAVSVDKFAALCETEESCSKLQIRNYHKIIRINELHCGAPGDLPVQFFCACATITKVHIYWKKKKKIKREFGNRGVHC